MQAIKYQNEEIKMSDLVGWIPIIITAIATSALAIITYYYVKEMRKMREDSINMYLESVKPIFSLRPSLIIRDEPMELYLLNTGGVAKDVKIDTSVNGEKRDSFFVASIPTNGEVKLDTGLKEIREKKKKIDVLLSYKTSYGKELKTPLTLDYKELSEDKRKLSYNYTVAEKMLQYIGNGLVELHNDAKNGKFKSDKVTVYPEKKPTRGKRKK